MTKYVEQCDFISRVFIEENILKEVPTYIASDLCIVMYWNNGFRQAFFESAVKQWCNNS